MRSAVVLMCVAGLAACGSKPAKTVIEYEQREYITNHQNQLDYTSAWYNQERAGSAYRAEGHYHVLGKRDSEELIDAAPAGQFEDYTFITNPALALQNKTAANAASYSIYELRSWKRFCGDGKMTITDWNYISKAGRTNVPSDLSMSCVPKSYTRQDYVRAWKSDCGNSKPSKGDLIIRSQSVKPKRRCEL